MKPRARNHVPAVRAALALIAIVAGGAGASKARADQILNLTQDETNRLMNLDALQEAVVGTLSQMTLPLGFVVGQQLAFSGTFTGQGWSVTLNGPYNNVPVNISFNAAFDPTSGTGSFTSAGTIGVPSWSGTGNWTSAVVNPQTLSLTFDSAAAISGQADEPDYHSSKSTFYTPLGDFIASTTVFVYVQTVNGRVVGINQAEENDLLDNRPPRKDGSVFANYDGQFVLNTAFALDLGTVSGTVQTVPGPASLIPGGTAAMIGLGLARSRRRR